MSPARPWLELVRFEEYGPLFLLCGIAGSLYAGVGSLPGLAGLLSFIGFFSASAFVLNDVTDWQEDSSDPRSGNPLSRGLLSRPSAIAAFFLLAGVSLASLYFVAPPALYAAPLVYGLYWGYSWGPQFKARQGVDIVVHGSVPALFVFMGSALSGGPPAGAVLISGIVFCFAAMSGLLQELRDFEKDAKFRRTTVSALGAHASLDAAAALMGVGVALFVLATLVGALPLPMVLMTPLAYLLVSPLLSLRSDRADAEEAILAIRTRGLALTAVVFAAYLVLIYAPL